MRLARRGDVRGLLGVLLVSALAACGSSSDGSPQSDTAPISTPSTIPDGVELRIVFVHGILGGDAARGNAHNELAPLDTLVTEKIRSRAGDKIRLATTRVNVYTDENDAVITPSIDDLVDGSGQPTARAWVSQLAKKTNRIFPNGKNIVFVGHSTGARAAAALANSDAFRDRVAGVVTLHGMIDALNNGQHDVIGPTSFVAGCKIAVANGWCEYAGHVSGVADLDWVARERHVLSLVGAGACSPSVWVGVNDQLLPIRAQSSPWVPGIMLAPVSGSTFAPAHGTFYGQFCHSDVTNRGSPRHAAANGAASDAIVRWLFDAAPRVVGDADPNQPIEIASLPAMTLSEAIVTPGPCPDGRRPQGPPDVVGVCRHPGFSDGDDHAFDGRNHVEAAGTQCDGNVRVSHSHVGENHAQRVWTKRYSLPEGGGLVSTLK